jgi:hypothetical protein
VTIFNTGALWLYAGPGSSSPTPLLAARVFPRGTNAVASALTKLQQPTDFDGSANIGARGLNAGAVDPRGFWNGGVSREREGGRVSKGVTRICFVMVCPLVPVKTCAGLTAVAINRLVPFHHGVTQALLKVCGLLTSMCCPLPPRTLPPTPPHPRPAGCPV